MYKNNENNGQQYLSTAVQQADADRIVVEIHPQNIIIVHIIGVSHHNESEGAKQTIELVSESTYERFEIVSLADNNAVGGRSKLGILRRATEKLCGGWSVQFFNACDTSDDHYRMMIDRVRRILLINADVFRMPYRSFLKLIGRLPEMIDMASKSVESRVKGVCGTKGLNNLSAGENARIGLVVSERGLLFPHGFLLNANEQMMRIAITDTDLIISVGRRRWIHRSAIELPLHAYKITVTIEDDAYLVALPLDVLEVLLPGSELEFDAFAD